MGLRKVTTIRYDKRGWLNVKHRLWTSKTLYFEFTDKEFNELSAEHEAGPALIGHHGQRYLWWAEDAFYWEDSGLSAHDVELLIWDRRRRDDAKLERLRTQREAGSAIEIPESRKPIPDDVKASVWERDRGECIRCGRKQDLQFDHVIPISKGGGSSLENVQILCGSCDREKSDSIV